jgi:signal transduction histidine kinase
MEPMTPAPWYQPRSWPLSVKIPLLITLIVVGVAATIGVVAVSQERQRLAANIGQQALVLARSMAATTPEALVRHDPWTLYKTLRQVALQMPEGHVLSAMVLDADGRLLADLAPAQGSVGLPFAPADADEAALNRAARALSGPGTLDGAGFVEAVVPVESGGKTLGVVRLRLSTAEIAARTREAAVLILAVTLGLAAVGSALGAVLSVRAIQPLRALAAAMEAVGRGEPAPALPAGGDDEIGHLMDSFNRMSSELEEKRRLEQEMARNEKLLALGRIAAGVAHEVNNPLAGMLNFVSTLRAHPEDGTLPARYLPLIEKGLGRIRGIVQGLLAEVRSGEAGEAADATSLDDLRELVAAEIGERPVRLAWENGLGPDERVDRSRLHQVLLNLLRNGLQALPPEGGRLSFQARVEGDALVFEVEDDGVGIDPERMSHLFDPFYTSRAGGTGLGLWISYRLVGGMGGRIDVDSEPGRGARFRVTIPRIRVEATA